MSVLSAVMALMSSPPETSTHNPCLSPQKTHLASGCSMLQVYLPFSFLHCLDFLDSTQIWLVALLLPYDPWTVHRFVATLLCLSSSGTIGLCPGNQDTAHLVLWLLPAPGLPLTLESCSCCSLVLCGRYSFEKLISLRSEAPESIQYITQIGIHGGAQVYHSQYWHTSLTRFVFAIFLLSFPSLATLAFRNLSKMGQ